MFRTAAKAALIATAIAGSFFPTATESQATEMTPHTSKAMERSVSYQDEFATWLNVPGIAGVEFNDALSISG